MLQTDGCESIGEASFGACSALTNVILTDNVTSVGEGSFYWCSNLKNITISESVKKFASEAFERCENIAGVYYTGDLTGWCAIDFEDFCSNPIYNYITNLYIDGELLKDDIFIPGSATSIGDYAFYGYLKIKEVSFGDGVKSIGKEAFRHCDLISVTISDSVTSIDDNAFEYCSELTSVTLGSGLKSIGNYAFASCSNIAATYYPGTREQFRSITFGIINTGLFNSVIYEYMSERPYYEGTFDELVWRLYTDGELIISGTGEMTESVTNPWDKYELLVKSVTISDGVTSISNDLFYRYDALTSVTISDSVTSIGRYAFALCDALTSVTIGNGVTNIGANAFWGCTSLGSITIPGGATIGACAFESCIELSDVTIGDGITDIGYAAFNSCFNLTNLTFGNGVKTIGKSAFVSCINLKTVSIPDSVTSIGENAFALCDNLTSISVASNNPAYSTDENDVLFNKNKTVLVQYPQGNERTSYTIPDSVTSIGESAFYGCDNLTSITIPNGVTSIGGHAFAYCDNLTNITIPESVTSIGEKAFAYCETITSISVASNNSAYSNDENGVLFDKNKTVIVLYPQGNERTSYLVPDSVTKINKSAFGGCNLTDIYYSGTREEWNNILEDKNDSSFSGISIHCKHIHFGNTFETIVESTCNEGGSRVCICSCGFRYTEETPVLGHDIITQKAVNSTCTETGLTEGQHCSRCDDMTVKQEFVPVLGHDIIIDNAVEPTCTETGLTEGQHCTRCDDATVAQEIIPALNHKDTLVKVVAKAPTCTEIGWDAYEYCTVCSYTTYEEKAALKHDIVIDNAVEPTCTETGLTEGQHCSRCDDATVAQEIIPVVKHSAVVSKNDSTSHWDECSCGEKINLEGHKYVNDYICDVCEYEKMITFKMSIRNPSTTTISYGDSILLHADMSEVLPSGWTIKWTADNGNFSYSANGETCTISPNKSGDTTFTATVYDENGNEISKDTQTMKSKAGFFDKIIAFFKKLFGATKVIPQAFKGIF